MAQPEEPMDVDSSVCDFDDKENSICHSNVLPKTPCTEKGYEELDVSELNMKLRYSITPVSSPMSRSFTASCDVRFEGGDTDNTLLTRSLHSAVKNESVRPQKMLPLQMLPTEPHLDGNRNPLRPIDSVDTNITVTVTNDDDNLSLPSSSSSLAHTPEATTPTKELPKQEPSSPIMRGLKSVLSMFRSSQSPIPPDEVKQEVLSPVEVPNQSQTKTQNVLASTPLGPKSKEVSKGLSPHRESLVFNEDLEKELQWKDESSIIFSNEKIPIHKLFPQAKIPPANIKNNSEINDNLDSTVEYMDISCNESVKDRTITEQTSHLNTESENEFQDCESTFTKDESKAEFNDFDVNTNINDTKNLTTNRLLSDIDDLLNESTTSFKDTTLNEIFTQDANMGIAHPNQSKEEISKDTIPKTFNDDAKYQSSLPDLGPELNLTVDMNQTSINELVPETLNVTNTIKTLLQNDSKENSVAASNTDIKNNLDLTIAKTDSLKDLPKIPVPEAGVTSALAQIALIADPRVLLFNVSTEEEKLANAVPADVPLPDDDDRDFASLEPTLNEIIKHNIAPDVIADVISAESKANNNFDVYEKNFQVNHLQNSFNVQDQNVDVIVESTVIENADTKDVIGTYDASVDDDTHKDIIEKISQNVIPPVKEHNSLSDVEQNNVKEELNKSAQDVLLYALNATVVKLNEATSPINVDVPIPIIEQDANIKSQINEQIVEQSKSLTNETSSISTVDGNSENIRPIARDQHVANIATEVGMDEQSINVQNVPETDLEKIETSNETIELKNKNSEHTLEPKINLELMENIAEIKEHPVNFSDLKELAMDTNETVVIEKNSIQAIESNADKNEQNIPLAPLPDVVSSETEAQELPNAVHESLNITDHVALVELSKNTSESQNVETVNDDLNSKKLKDIATVCVNEIISESLKNISEKTSNPEVKLETQKDEIDVNISNQEEPTQDTVGHELEKKKADFEINPEGNLPFQKTVPELTDTQVEAMDISLNIPDNVEEVLSDTNNTTVNQNKELAQSDIKDDVVVKDIISEVKEMTNNCISNEASNVINYENTENNELIKDYVVSGVENEITNPKSNEINILNETQTLVEKTVEVPMKEQVSEQFDEKMDIVDEEVVASANNSPFVSVSAGLDLIPTDKPLENFEQVDNANYNCVISNSPPIVSKGYNFNFDDIENPFATKTKIRMSPTPSDPSNTIPIDQTFEELPKKEIDRNRRKSQPARTKAGSGNKKMNSTFSGRSNARNKTSENIKASIPAKTFDSTLPNEKDKNIKSTDNVVSTNDNGENIQSDTIIIEQNQQDINKTAVFDVTDVEFNNNQEQAQEIENKTVILSDDKADIQDGNKTSSDQIIIEKTKSFIESDVKHTSSSEQSAYYSAGSSEGTSIKNVFNLPEIDDINFNPFASKKKLRQSPPPSLDDVPIKITTPQDSFRVAEKVEDPVSAMSQYAKNDTFQKTEDCIDKDLHNISNATCSSKATVRTVNTEDDDTVEGPFLESEDFEHDDKISDFDGDKVDMMQFADLQSQGDNPDGGEFFIDAEAFEFLLNQNQTNIVTDSGKESLFLKFDPLFAKRMSTDGVAAALKNIQNRQSTPSKVSKPPSSNVPLIESPIAGPSIMNNTFDGNTTNTAEESSEDPNTTVIKPTMVVNPAVNPVPAPRTKISTPPQVNRRSLTFTSPAIAVIDRLLSMSANNSPTSHDIIPRVSREQSEADIALTQLRELLAEKEINVYQLRTESKDLRDRLANMETQVKTLESISEERLKKINELNNKLTEKTQMNKSMAAVVEEYERTIASLIAETEQDRKRHAEERIQLIKERDEQTAHLASMEVSFSDLHSKYEKSKQTILSFKSNEDSYKKSLKEFEENLTKMECNYELLKQHATSKLNHANQELEKMNRAHETEVLKMKAMIKRNELHITSLEETLAQKTKANNELTMICEELINKVG